MYPSMGIVVVAHWETNVAGGGLSRRVDINMGDGLSGYVANGMGDGVSGDSVGNGVRYGAGGLVLYRLGGGGRSLHQCMCMCMCIKNNSKVKPAIILTILGVLLMGEIYLMTISRNIQKY